MNNISLHAASWLTAATTTTRHELSDALHATGRNRGTIFGGAALAGFLGSASVAVAQSGAASESGVESAAKPFLNLIDNGTTLLILVAAALAILFGVIAGFQFMTAGSNVAQANKAKTTIKNVAIGLILIGVVYLLKSLILEVVSGLSSGSEDSKTSENLNLLKDNKIK